MTSVVFHRQPAERAALATKRVRSESAPRAAVIRLQIRGIPDQLDARFRRVAGRDADALRGEYRLLPNRTKLTATVGYFKALVTLGDSQSSNDFFFLERPSIVETSRNIAAGDAHSVAGLRYAENRYFVSGYLTGAPCGSQTAALAQPQQTGGVIRVAGRPVATEDVDLHLGVSASSAFHIQRMATGQTLNIQERPELRIDTNRLIGTGALNASSAYTYGPEFSLRYRNLLFQGEYGRIGVNRANSPNGPAGSLPNLEFDGGCVEASYVLTGKPRSYVTTEGAFGSPKIKQLVS